MSRYREQVAAALGAVRILGPTQYAWLGPRSRRLPVALDGVLDAAERRRYLVSCLREELYCSFYCHGGPVVARWGEPQPVSADPWLLAAMSDANASEGGWEPGWTVDRVDGDTAVVTGSRLRVRVPVADCAGPMRSGGGISVRLPEAMPAYSPGYWTVLGDTAVNGSGAGDVRVYWHVTASGAPALVGAITSHLNGAGVPFRLKVADHPFRLERCDAAVLYLDGDRFRALRPQLLATAESLAAHLHPRIPAFTLELAPGVGLAEHESGESFGVRRCELLADGIVRAHEHRAADPLATIAARFAEDGVDIDAPYRDPALAGRHVL
ncbi:MAG TPA: T3SS effector HopA1 family protein [Solirubrobacteraceae bacterium]|nr:T3SS effector HopA1 family protein [Solirubrobacteraceae bacterium]